MAMVNPGVSVQTNLLTSASSDDAATMPLFIAYSANSDTTMQPVRVASPSQAVALFKEKGTLACSLRHFFDNGGLCCYVLSLGPGEEDRVERLKALINELRSTSIPEAIEACQAVGLIVVPEMSELNDVSSEANLDAAALWYQGWQAVLQLCTPGKQRFALLDMPDVPEQANALTTKSFSADLCQNGAAWWPRIQTHYVDDADKTVYRLLSPLPAVAAAIQRSAAMHGVWKAPANIRLAKTLRPVRNILLSQALLNSKGIHCNLIRSFAARGVRLWGCRTLLNDESSPWRYIQTRLLVNSVERQISRLARVFLFEPNEAQTWVKLQGQIWTWLREQWLAGAFFGATEEEAFTLNIGLNDTMSAEDIRAGKMILQVQLALLAPAEFIEISLTLDTRTSSVTTQSGADNG